MLRKLSVAWTLAGLLLTNQALASGYLGVVLGQLPGETPDRRGALVQEIFADSPGDRDGMRTGDLIVGVNDQEIQGAEGLVDAIQLLKAGDQVRFKVQRAGEKEKKDVAVTLGDRPDKPLAELPLKKRPTLGIAFTVQGDGRLAVAEFLPDSAAEQAGMKTGDVIVSVSGHEVTDYIDMLSLISGHKEGDEVKIEVQRDGQKQEVTLKAKEVAPPRRFE